PARSRHPARIPAGADGRMAGLARGGLSGPRERACQAWSPIPCCAGLAAAESGMRVTGARFLAGPNIHDDSSGIVIRNEMTSLPPAGAPLASPSDRIDPIFAALDMAGL